MASGTPGELELHAVAVHLVQKDRIVDRVLCFGEQRDVDGLFDICDIKVPASLHEGRANVLLGTMACGSPVIATDVGDNTQSVVEGD